MAIHIWTVLCTKASIDKTSNIVSLLEVVEQMNVGGIPEDKRDDVGVAPTRLELVSLWMRSDLDVPERKLMRFKLLQPDDSIVEGGQFEVNLTEESRLRMVVKLNNFPIKGEGIYYFITEFMPEEDGNWEEVSRLPLVVRFED